MKFSKIFSLSLFPNGKAKENKKFLDFILRRGKSFWMEPEIHDFTPTKEDIYEIEIFNIGSIQNNEKPRQS